MAVYIFPVDAAKIDSEELHAGNVEVAVKALNLAIVRDAKPDYRETDKKSLKAVVFEGDFGAEKSDLKFQRSMIYAEI